MTKTMKTRIEIAVAITLSLVVLYGTILIWA